MLKAALRREKMAETALQRLEAEIDHMNHLVCMVTMTKCMIIMV